MLSLWFVRPLSIGGTFSLTFAAPLLLLPAFLLVRIPRETVLRDLRRLPIEFLLLAGIVGLSLLSLVNAESPIRSFRIIYPSLLPFALFLHLVAVKRYAPELLAYVPRVMVWSALLFSSAPLIASLVLSPLQGLIFEEYRMRGFFENSIQHSIALATISPFVILGFVEAKTPFRKMFWAGILLVFAYTQFRAGSKSALGFSTVAGLGFFFLAAYQSRNFVTIATTIFAIGGVGAFLYLFGLEIAEAIDPITAGKIREIIDGGVSNYQSIESRQELWREAIEQGKRHWLVGTGAGEQILGVSHAHNLVLDYFKGIGFFGALSILLLCGAILLRALRQVAAVLSGKGGRRAIMVLACYTGASIYVICNQLSDCFGPSTVGFLWLVYLVGVFLSAVDEENATDAAV